MLTNVFFNFQFVKKKSRFQNTMPKTEHQYSLVINSVWLPHCNRQYHCIKPGWVYVLASDTVWSNTIVPIHQTASRRKPRHTMKLHCHKHCRYHKRGYLCMKQIFHVVLGKPVYQEFGNSYGSRGDPSLCVEYLFPVPKDGVNAFILLR
jgi:hypothetical protein